MLDQGQVVLDFVFDKSQSSLKLFLTCFDWILPFSNFFRKFGNLVAGFLTMRLSFFAITCTPSLRVSCYPLLEP